MMIIPTFVETITISIRVKISFMLCIIRYNIIETFNHKPLNTPSSHCRFIAYIILYKYPIMIQIHN